MSAALVRGAWVLTMADGLAPLRDGAVAIGDDGAIEAVGAFDHLRAQRPDVAVHGDGTGIVLPGFVNAHVHLTECLIPGMAEDATLWTWFERVVNPAGLVITREDVAIGTRLKAVEMLRSGITTVSDMSCHRNLGSLASLGGADGLADAGLRGVVSFGAEDRYDGAPGPAAFLDEQAALAERVRDEPLLSFRMGIGTVLGMSDALFAATVEACRREGHGVHTHLHEVREEVTGAQLEHGCGSIELCDRRGLLEHPVLAAHCVWCSARDVGLLAGGDVSVVHNPVCNMLLGSGVCPVGDLRAAGVTVALGTDGAASNDSQDMLGSMKTAALLHRVHALDPTAMRAVDVLRMATIEGARALGLDGVTGSLEVGKRADVVLLDGATPELATIHEPHQQVVFCATPRSVADVWVDGAQRLAGGEPVGVDLPAAVADARAAAADLVARSGLGATESWLLDRTAVVA